MMSQRLQDEGTSSMNKRGMMPSPTESKSVSRTTANDIVPLNGPGAAALLASGVGVASLGVFALCGDAYPAIAEVFNFYAPTGPLSGVTTSAIVVWLAVWFGLGWAWNGRSVPLVPVVSAAFGGLIVGLLLIFPPIMDFIQGK